MSIKKHISLKHKAAPLHRTQENTRTLDNGVVLRLIHCGETLTVSAVYEHPLEQFDNLYSLEEAAYIEDYLTRKYSGVSADDLPMLTA